MQAPHRSSRILLPVRMGWVWLSLIVALTLNFVPVPQIPGIPDFVALVLAFWCVREPLRVSMGAAFVLGVLTDIGHGSAMGQHALAYVLLAFTCGAMARRLLWFPPAAQALQMVPIFLMTQVVMLIVRLIAGADFPGWDYFFSAFTTSLLWFPIHYILLLPQMQPIEHDENRPL
ncbi:rod shape-determining protein MreD [Niveibacterium terrae]|uniref:rod shape-determining protein MreD n=1 Tax=Niveibacterium terrae TaxID=3373598 RepID=UPI003A8D6D21